MRWIHVFTALLSCLAYTRAVIPDVTTLAVKGSTLTDQLLHLASFSDHPQPAVTRILFTENDIRAREYVKGLMREAGLVVTQDPMGSIFGTLPAADGSTSGPAVGTGSHCDAIPNAGAYDGTVGVIGGIAALKALREAGFRSRVPLQVIFFTSEEPTRFGLSCLSSRAMAGVLAPRRLQELRDENGTSFLEAAAAAGAGGATVQEVLKGARLTADTLGAFLELHIEQGLDLERLNVPIGVVTAIAAPATCRVTFKGAGGHAGALIMRRRNDASLAAAELALAVESSALFTKSDDTVATAGQWEVLPNAVNSVPSEVTLVLDIRDVDGARRDLVLEDIRNTAAAIAAKRRVELTLQMLNEDPPTTAAASVVAAVEASAQELGVESRRMPSRAYHDTLFMSQIAPSGMIFIPCKGGWSHRPDEYASPEDIERGVRVLAGAMARLAGEAAAGGDSSGNAAHGGEL